MRATGTSHPRAWAAPIRNGLSRVAWGASDECPYRPLEEVDPIRSADLDLARFGIAKALKSPKGLAKRLWRDADMNPDMSASRIGI